MNQYKDKESRTVVMGRSSSVQSKNFSPILSPDRYNATIIGGKTYHASRASGLEDRTKLIVEGRVACSREYALPKR